MTRTSRTSFALALALTLAAVPVAVAQGPGGRGGPGGPGGFGGPGGRGGSSTQLLSNEAVQVELKLTPEQINKIKLVNDASAKKRASIFPPRGNNGPGGNGGNGGNPANVGNGGNAGNNGGRGGNNGGGGGNGGQPGGNGPGGQGGGPGGFANMTEEERAAMQERFAAMQTLQKDTDAAIAKILNPKQRTRLSQIHLQRQGLNAFVGAELPKALNLSEETVEQIREILNGQNQARRQQGTKMRELTAQFIGGNGGNNGRPTREQMQALQENPDYQAKMTEQRKSMDAENKTLEETTKGQIARLLSKKQRDAYTKLLGEPFDLTKLQGPGGPGGRNGGPGGPGNNPAPTPAAEAAKAPAAGGGSTPAPAAKNSLRARRGGTTPNN